MTTTEQDKEAIISIVREMAESMTGAQSTRHWAPDVLWFDIPPFASRGVAPARKLFDDTFANFESCQVDILELDEDEDFSRMSTDPVLAYDDYRRKEKRLELIFKTSRPDLNIGDPVTLNFEQPESGAK